jgi:hypothetical protein
MDIRDCMNSQTGVKQMQNLKRYLLSFAGGFVGIAIYQLLTAPLVGGLHLIATVFATRLLHFVLSGFATGIIIGAGILSILGTAHLADCSPLA